MNFTLKITTFQLTIQPLDKNRVLILLNKHSVFKINIKFTGKTYTS